MPYFSLDYLEGQELNGGPDPIWGLAPGMALAQEAAKRGASKA